MWLRDSTTFACQSRYLSSWFKLLRYLYADNLYTIYIHPDQCINLITSHNFQLLLIYTISYGFKLFYIHPVSNMGSHSTRYALFVPRYLWMLAWRWCNMTETCCHNKILIFIQCCCVLTVTLNILFYFSYTVELRLSCYRYIYTDSVKLSSVEEAGGVLYASKKYMLPHLSHLCRNYLLTNLRPSNVLSIFDFAEGIQDTELLEPCMEVSPYYTNLLSLQCRQFFPNCLCGDFNPLNAELNPICYLLALLPHHFLHVSRIRVKML